MKTGIHPQYYPEAKFRCACGKAWVGGATVPEISVEICSNCHPFYTGKEKLVDTRGRIEKIQRKMAKSRQMKETQAQKKPRAKKQKNG